MRLLCVDVDGVLTDAGMYYGPDGEVLKKFNTRDGMGLARVRQAGVAVAIISGEDSAIDTHAYDHYLHHKYFECNYADGVIPLDKWFGTFHDGSAEAQERMDKRFMEQARLRQEKKARQEQRAS